MSPLKDVDITSRWGPIGGVRVAAARTMREPLPRNKSGNKSSFLRRGKITLGIRCLELGDQWSTCGRQYNVEMRSSLDQITSSVCACLSASVRTQKRTARAQCGSRSVANVEKRSNNDVYISTYYARWADVYIWSLYDVQILNVIATSKKGHILTSKFRPIFYVP